MLSFNLAQPTVDAQLSTGVRLETGLDYGLQRDLAECRLDAEVARVLFYSNKIAGITRDNLTIGLLCDYIPIAKASLGVPADPQAFWTPSRMRYKKHLQKLASDIHQNRRLASDRATETCLDDFLRFLAVGWDIAD